MLVEAQMLFSLHGRLQLQTGKSCIRLGGH
uniref:Uncharacterized protein n=1 Tax=Arundo donax TaxID=35708 RepID=A0A0A9A0B5_ARUDO